MWRTKTRLKISKRQWLAIHAEFDAWQLLPAVTAPADRPACERAVRELYDSAGLPPPAFRWHGDPYAMLFEAAMDKAAGPSIHRELERSPAVLVDNLNDSPSLQRLKQLLSRRIHPLHVAATRRHVALISGPASEGAGVQVNLDQPAGLVAQLHAIIRSRLPAVGALKEWGDPLGGFMWSTMISERIVLIAILHEILGFEMETSAQQLTLARHCGLVIAQQGVCRLCDRPVEINRDDRGWLHGEGRAALRYRNGVELHFWHGVEMAPEISRADPDSITCLDITKQHTMVNRRILIERLGVERFVRRHATLMHEDDTGRLWAASFHRSRPEWAAVEVVNGTPEPDGSFRHYFLQVPPELETARAAVAWTFGLPPEAYNVAVRT